MRPFPTPDETADSLSVAALPLRDDSAGMVLNGAGQLLATLPGSLITTAPDGSAELLQFDLDGTLLNRLDLLPEYELVLHGLGENGRFYLGAVGQNRGANNDCHFELIEWTPESES
jgi:hypothetical protein